MKPLGSTDPTSVGSYRLLGVLGGGGMGRVYLGRSPAGRPLAIKVIRSEVAEDPVFRRRFSREVAAVRSVSPLFTAAMVDADTEAEPPWLATTYVNGPSLRDWVSERGPLAPGAVLMLAAGLAEALASIHRAGLVHRDLKPSNVLLDDAGPRIIDFGIAVLPDATQLTTSFVGTPAYLAPELVGGGEASAASDIFALGATLFFASTGQPLVNEGTMFQQLIQISTGRFDLSLVPRAVRPMVVRCLSRRPRDRPTADELARILVSPEIAAPGRGWYRAAADAAPAAPVRVRGWRLSRRRALVVGGVVATAIAGGGVGVAAAFGSGARRPRTPPAPGTVLWLAGSGAVLPGPIPGDQDPGVPIIVDQGARLITASGSRVSAVDPRGRRQWTRDLPTRLVTQRPWGDAVLIADLGSVWLLDAATGAQRFAVDLAAAERAAAREDGPDRPPTAIRQVITAGDSAFVNLGTATVAIDRQGRLRWRRARPAGTDGRVPAPDPLAAGGTWLVTRRVVGLAGEVSLTGTGTGDPRWSVQYAVPPPPSSAPPPPPPSGPPDGGPTAPDAAWQRSEARIGSTLVALRDAQDLRVVRVSDGGTVWRASSPTPVAAIELAGDLLLVSADRLTAYAAGTGEPAWQAPVRGARIAVTPDGGTIVAATQQTVSALDSSGRTRWQVGVPAGLGGALPDRVTIEGHAAYVTFRPRPDQRGALDLDVLAVAAT